MQEQGGTQPTTVPGELALMSAMQLDRQGDCSHGSDFAGVVAQHTAPRKGYSDFVQHTGPINSGQLLLVSSESQPLNNSFGVEPTLCADFIGMQSSLVRLTSRHRNLLIGLNSGESPESDNPLIISKTCTAVNRCESLFLLLILTLGKSLILSVSAVGGCWEVKHEQYSGSAEHKQCLGSEVPKKFVGSWWDGADLLHEKGRTANATLWDDYFFNHEENQYSSDLSDGRKPNLAYEQNQHLAEQQDNLPSLSDLVHYISLRDAVQPLRLGVLQEFRKTYSGATYEIFVVQKSTYIKSVGQH